MIKEVLDKVRRGAQRTPVLDVLNAITRHHRIQGSSGLESALRDLQDLLGREGYSTKLVEVPSDSGKGFMDTPISWDVEDAYLKISMNNEIVEEYSFTGHPTLLAAHSPSGEGCGQLSLCGEKCSGDAVIARGPAYEAYMKADARLVLVYDPKRYVDAVPYTGLFLHSSEIKDKVVMNIPYKTALRVLAYLFENPSRKVEVCWEARSRYTGRPMHALVACNNWSEPGVLLVSHICHPKPGAHDNASGSTANYVAAVASITAKLDIPLCYAWVPEYTGTVYLDEVFSHPPLGVINLDMVGSKQWATGSTLNIVNTPLYMESRVTRYTYIAVKAVFDTASSFGGFNLPGARYSLSPYTAGSDHDVFLSWGIDTVMLNEWPSKYYHTDMDTVETLSPRSITDTAVASLTAAYLFYNNYKAEWITRVFDDYLKSWYALEAAKTGFESSLEGISKILEERGRLKPGEMEKLKSPISTRRLREILGFNEYRRLSEIKGAVSYLSLYAPLAYINGLEDYRELFKLENLVKWKREEEELLEKSWVLVRDTLLK